MKSTPSKFKIALGIVAVCLTLCIAIIALYSPVIFQRGNPLPYLCAAAKLSDDTQYVQVKQTESECVYITRRGESDALLRMFAESTGAVFQEQMGGVYIFFDDDTEWLLESEIYWKNYTVWVVSVFSNDDTTQNYEQISHLLSLNVKATLNSSNTWLNMGNLSGLSKMTMIGYSGNTLSSPGSISSGTQFTCTFKDYS